MPCWSMAVLSLWWDAEILHGWCPKWVRRQDGQWSCLERESISLDEKGWVQERGMHTIDSGEPPLDSNMTNVLSRYQSQENWVWLHKLSTMHPSKSHRYHLKYELYNLGDYNRQNWTQGLIVSILCILDRHTHTHTHHFQYVELLSCQTICLSFLCIDNRQN